jgi:hypothetical protein
MGKATNPGANERQWFRAHPERFHRGHLATPTEIEDLREHGCFDGGAKLDDDCFIYALSRINRESEDLHRLFVVLRVGTGCMKLDAQQRDFNRKSSLGRLKGWDNDDANTLTLKHIYCVCGAWLGVDGHLSRCKP